MDTLELPPGQRIAYPLLLCAGQEVKLKICASQTVSASIGFECREPDASPPDPFIHNPEASCFVIDHEVKRTAKYLLAIASNSDEPLDLVVEITADLRERFWRTRFEALVQRLPDVFRGVPFFTVPPRSTGKPEASRQAGDDTLSGRGQSV